MRMLLKTLFSALAQKQGHQVIGEAREKADQILAEAQAKADELIDEATRQHEEAMERNRAEIAKEKEALIVAQQQVADFKNSLFDMYKSHLELISSMPETFDDDFNESQETAEEIAASVAGNEEDEDSAESARKIKGAYDASFGK